MTALIDFYPSVQYVLLLCQELKSTIKIEWETFPHVSLSEKGNSDKFDRIANLAQAFSPYFYCNNFCDNFLPSRNAYLGTYADPDEAFITFFLSLVSICTRGVYINFYVHETERGSA